MLKTIYTLVVLLFVIAVNVVAQINAEKINWPDKFDPAKSKFYVHNEIEINASPEVVWNILIDAKNWETYYKGAKNVVLANQKDKNLQANTVFNWKTMGLKFQSSIKEYKPNQLLAWLSEKKQIQGYHVWLIVPTTNGCKLITDESQNGWLTFFEKTFQPKKLKKLHDVWLAEIKKKAENKGVSISSASQNISLSVEERQILVATLQASLDKFNQSIQNLSSEQFSFKAKPNKWSIAECIEHVTLAELRFPKIVANEMSKPSNPDFRKKIRIKDDAIRPRMTSRKWKAKSPEIFKPSQQFESIALAVTAFQTQRKQTIDYIQTTSNDLRNHFWKHPLTGHIDLYQTLILMSAHLERHIEQIEIVKLTANFPI